MFKVITIVDYDYESNTGAFGLLLSIAVIYIALKHNNFLSWASTLGEPLSGLATVMIWATTGVGYLNLIVIVLALIILLGTAIYYLYKKVLGWRIMY